MSVTLPPDAHQIVVNAIAEGAGDSEVDVVVRALKLYEQFEERRRALRQDIEDGIASPTVPGEVVFAELEQLAKSLSDAPDAK